MANIIKITLPDGSTYDVGNSLCLGINNQTWNAQETQFTGTLDYTITEINNLITNGTFVWFKYYDNYDDGILMLFPDGEGYWQNLEHSRAGYLTNSGILVYRTAEYATLSSPAFTGTPTAPTPGVLDNSTKIATTAWVNNKITTVIPEIEEAAKTTKIYYVLDSGQSPWSGEDYETYNFEGQTIYDEDSTSGNSVTTDSIYDDLCSGILVILRVLDPNGCPIYCFPSIVGDDESWMSFSATYTASDDTLVTLNLYIDIGIYTGCNGYYSLPSGGGSGLPSVTSSDNGKFLRVVNGAWAAATVPSANGVSF